MAAVLEAEVIYTPNGGPLSPITEVKSEQHCSHRALFGTGVLRTSRPSLALTRINFPRLEEERNARDINVVGC
jgi:hypothetical protein